MPELPEVEVAVRALRAVVVGRTVRDVPRWHPATRRALPDDVVPRVVGRRIDAVLRRGKHQLLALDDGATLHAHFRMAGDWLVGRVDAPPAKYARAALDLDDGTRVSLVDPRALATIVWVAPTETSLPALGLEPTDAAFTATALRAALATRRGPIKPVLLDQRVVAGVGNIYAAEALWHARISPRAPASSLSLARVARLADALRDVIEAAIANPGRYSTGESATRVYDHEGEPCERCGATIRRIVQAGRSTYYCPRCQAR